MGPNVKKLICRKLSLIAIPPGGGLANGIQFLMSKDNILAGAKEATQWVEQAIAVVKMTPDNPYGNDDEAIAGAILNGIEKRKAEQRQRQNA